MTTTNTSAAGIGVYLEFRNTPGPDKVPATWQLIILPQGPTPDGATARQMFFNRRISSISPRKTWKGGLCGNNVIATGLGHITDLDERRAYALAQGTNILMQLLDTIARNRYTPFMEPCYFEVTKEDLASARTGKIPYKALGRIWKVRKALGFPDEFIAADPSAI